MNNSIQFSAGLDVAPLARGFDEATRRAAIFGQKFKSSLAGLELMGDRRVRRNVGALTTDLLSTGDAAGAAANAFGALSNTFRVGLAGGVGLAAVAAIITTISKNASEAHENTAKLSKSTKELIKNAAFAGPEQGTNSLLEKLKEARIEERKAHDQGRQLDPFLHPVKAISVAVADLVTKGDANKTRDKVDKIEADNFRLVAQYRQKILAAGAAEISMTRDLISGNETAAKQTKLRLDFLREINQMKSLKASPEALATAKAGFDLKSQKIADEDEIARARQTSASRLAGLVTTGMSPSLQRIESIKDRIRIATREAAQPTHTEQERTDLGIERIRGENDLFSAQYGEDNKTWEERSSEMMGQRKFQNFVKAMSPSSPNAYLTNPEAYDQRDILGNGTGPMRGDYQSKLGDLSRHVDLSQQMDTYKGSDSFRAFFDGKSSDKGGDSGGGDSGGGGASDMGDVVSALEEIGGKLDALISGLN